MYCNRSKNRGITQLANQHAVRPNLPGPANESQPRIQAERIFRKKTFKRGLPSVARLTVRCSYSRTSGERTDLRLSNFARGHLAQEPYFLKSLCRVMENSKL